MSPTDIAKLASNALIAGALVLFVLFAGLSPLVAIAVMAAILVPSAAPAVAEAVRVMGAKKPPPNL